MKESSLRASRSNLIVLALSLVLAGCSTMQGAWDTVADGTVQAWDGVVNAFDAPATAKTAPQPQPELVVEFDNGGKAVYALDMRQTALIDGLMLHVDAAFYDGLFIERGVPNLLAETENGVWHGKPAWVLTVPSAAQGRATKSGGLGLVRNPDGSYGPRLVFMRGSTLLEGEMMPDNVKLGTLVSGAATIKELKRGDRIVKLYGRKF